MNYIVNPSVFYLISVLDGLNDASFLIGGVLLFILILFTILYFEYSLDKKKMKTRITITSIIFAITVITCILIPSRRDMEKMLIASYATEDNITAATNYGKNLVDYIFEKVEKTNEED